MLNIPYDACILNISHPPLIILTLFSSLLCMQHDRAGYYICWGCMMWVPSIYTVHTFYLTLNPVLLSLPAAVLLTLAGVYFVWQNYDCDRYIQILHT